MDFPKSNPKLITQFSNLTFTQKLQNTCLDLVLSYISLQLFPKTMDPTTDTTQNDHMGTRVWHSLSSFYCSSFPSQNPLLFPPTSGTISPWIFSLTHSTYFPSSLFQISNFFSLTHRPKTTYTMANSEPTTVNTTNSHKTKTKTKKISTKRKSNHQLQPQKEKNSNHQYHHEPHKPTPITA